MADLSSLTVRTTQQARPSSGRVNIIPRAETEAPKLGVFADMRNASRSSSGAEQLLKIFDDVQKGADTLSGYIQENRDVRDASSISQQMLSGNVDPELLKRSEVARSIYAKGKGEEEAHLWGEQATAIVQEALADRNNPVDELHIEELIDNSIKEFAFDPEGKPRDFGTPEANLKVAEMVSRKKLQLRTEAVATIKRQVLEDGLNRSVFNQIATVKDGGQIDVESFMRSLMPGTDMKQAKDALISAGQDLALSLIDSNPDGALSVIDSLLSSKRENGVPSLAPEELETVRAMRRRLDKEADAAKEERQRELLDRNKDAFADRLMGVPGKGVYPTAREIQQARAEGKLEAEAARTLLNWIETDVREAEADRRARERAAGTSVSGYTPSGSAIMAMVYEGRITPQAARAEVMRRAGLGEYGAGNDRRKTVSKMLSEINNVDSVHKGGFSTATSAFKSEVISMRRDIRRLPAPQRRKAEKWIKTVEDAGVAAIGAQMHKSGADGQKVGEAVSRSVARDFLSAFPDAAR